MPDDALSPATREDVLFTLGYSLQFGLTGKPHKLMDHQRLVEIQAAYLERSGFVLMRRRGCRRREWHRPADGVPWRTTAHRRRSARTCLGRGFYPRDPVTAKRKRSSTGLAA